MNMLTFEAPFGELRLYGHADELVALHLPNSEDAPDAPEGRSRVLDTTARQLTEYFAGTRREFDLPLAPEGTAFQKLVWRALLKIRFGETCSYGDIARAIKRPAASRAVGAANGRNPIAIIVPCHRVVRSDGALGGYRWGLDRKRQLLDSEKARHSKRARGEVTPAAELAAPGE